MITYDIINKNLLKLDRACKQFPNILGKYKKCKQERAADPDYDNSETLKLADLAKNFGLGKYIELIDFSINNKNIIIPDVSFNELKSKMIEGCMDASVKSFISKKIKRGMHSFLLSNKFKLYSGTIAYGSKKRPKYYQSNFYKSRMVIVNYAIQNEIDVCDVFRNQEYSISFFINEIEDYQAEINTEVKITAEIVKSLNKKISSIKYDFRKLNFVILKEEIEKSIRNKMLSVVPGEKLKCIESSANITKGKIYDVISYKMGNKGSLFVQIKNDENKDVDYNYRLFETLIKSREEYIDILLDNL